MIELVYYSIAMQWGIREYESAWGVKRRTIPSKYK